jgi:DNA polymerase III delta prime subunit
MELFPSTLIISADPQKTQNKIKEIFSQLNQALTPNNPDCFVLNEDTGWGIDQVRSAKKFLAQKPFNHDNKIILIQESHNLNTEAQNALLKTLEEPGNNNFLILTTSKPSALLPTIISRCFTFKLNYRVETDPKTKILTKTGSVKKDLLVSEEFGKNKDDILPLLEEQLKLYQQKLIECPSKDIAKTTEKIIKSIQMIHANVDPKSALDYFFLA